MLTKILANTVDTVYFPSVLITAGMLVAFFTPAGSGGTIVSILLSLFGFAFLNRWRLRPAPPRRPRYRRNNR